MQLLVYDGDLLDQDVDVIVVFKGLWIGAVAG